MQLNKFNNFKDLKKVYLFFLLIVIFGITALVSFTNVGINSQKQDQGNNTSAFKEDNTIVCADKIDQKENTAFLNEGKNNCLFVGCNEYF